MQRPTGRTSLIPGARSARLAWTDGEGMTRLHELSHLTNLDHEAASILEPCRPAGGLSQVVVLRSSHMSGVSRRRGTGRPPRRPCSAPAASYRPRPTDGGHQPVRPDRPGQCRQFGDPAGERGQRRRQRHGRRGAAHRLAVIPGGGSPASLQEFRVLFDVEQRGPCTANSLVMASSSWSRAAVGRRGRLEAAAQRGRVRYSPARRSGTTRANPWCRWPPRPGRRDECNDAGP